MKAMSSSIVMGETLGETLGGSLLGAARFQFANTLFSAIALAVAGKKAAEYAENVGMLFVPVGHETNAEKRLNTILNAKPGEIIKAKNIAFIEKLHAAALENKAFTFEFKAETKGAKRFVQEKDIHSGGWK